MWLPRIISRPVLPFEPTRFVAELPHARAAVRFSMNRGLPLAAIAAMPAKEGTSEVLGTAVRFESVTEHPNGDLEVDAVGLRPFKVISDRAQAYKLGQGERAVMINMVRVSWRDDHGTREKTASLALRDQLFGLLESVGPVDSDEMRNGKSLASDAEFSWWVAARLPLPPAARGILLHISSAHERLSVCATVLAAASEGFPGKGELPGGHAVCAMQCCSRL